MKILLYCTKSKPQIYKIWNGVYELVTDYQTQSHCNFYGSLNGKIVGECDCEVEEVSSDFYRAYDFTCHDYVMFKTRTLTNLELEKHSCVDYKTACKYLGYYEEDKKKVGYAIHFKNLIIYDKSRELSDVCKYDTSYNNMFGWIKEESEKYIPLDKAPQNMCYVYDKGEKKILISIRSQWMCLIANRIKDVELRKRVLKALQEMIK